VPVIVPAPLRKFPSLGPDAREEAAAKHRLP
jgi:hypothetical protein